MIVPDAIEPVLGWKSLIWDGGILQSPQQRTKWLPKKALSAECRVHEYQLVTHGSWVWRVSAKPATTDEDINRIMQQRVEKILVGVCIKYGDKMWTNVSQSITYQYPATTAITGSGFTYGTTNVFYVTNTTQPFTFPPGNWIYVGTSTTTTGFSQRPSSVAHTEIIPERPNVPLPDGMNYVLEFDNEPHEIPSPICSCGIYIVDKPDHRIEPYSIHPLTVVAKVAGWGNVIPGSSGARVAHAYPQELFIINPNFPKLILAGLEDYGVPIHHVGGLLGLRNFIAKKEEKNAPVWPSILARFKNKL